MKPAAATFALLAGVQRRHGWFPGLFALERGWAGAQPLAVPVLFSSVLLRGGGLCRSPSYLLLAFTKINALICRSATKQL